VAEPHWQETGARIDALIAASASGGVVARERAEELVRLVADLYGAGLERLLEIVHDSGALTDEVADALAGDQLVSSLLLVHGLHPYDAETRIEQALAGIHGDVELLEVTAGGVARLRMTGGGHGCGSSSDMLKAVVEEAIEAAAPEITAIEVEEPAAPLIPVSALFSRLADGPSRAPRPVTT
jgi:Fe-S cluster biogenesis protein NfuA